MSSEEARILKERAADFLENAKYLLKIGKYDLAAFNLEQSCQLLLKYILLVKAGTYPRTHSIRRLLMEVEKALPEKGISKLMESEITKIPKLEDAYLVFRYLPRKYIKEEVEELLDLVERIWEELGDV